MKTILLMLLILFVSCSENENKVIEEDKVVLGVKEEVIEIIDTTPYDNMSLDEKNETLTEASESGDLEAVKALIKSGASVNFKRESSGFTALMLASSEGQIDVVKYLINAGADPNISDNYDGYTALIKASYSASYNDDEAKAIKYLEIVKYLIKSGANINFKTEYGHTALTASMQHGGETPEVVKYLIDADADLNAIKGFNYSYSGNTVWQELMEYNSTEIINYLIENKADISDVDIVDRAGAGWLQKVKESLDLGVDINFQNAMEYTPLISASQDGHLEIVKYLVENGADLNIKNHWGHTALMVASENNHTEIVEYLMKNGATE